MSYMKRENYLEIRLKKTDGQLKIATVSEQMLYDMFCENVIDGQTVYMFIEACGESASAKQKKLLNMNVRKISEHTGMSFIDVKKLVKSRCGLDYKKTEDLTSEEINLMYNEIRNICNEINIPIL